MGLEVDHAFIGCAQGAPEGDALLHMGLVEGSRNTHRGQGTANRRFYFDNFMLELLWVDDPEAASNRPTVRTRLLERCFRRQPGISPFGVVFRPAGSHDAPAPFQTWSYRPGYLPPGASIEIAEGTTLHEPELIYLPFLRPARVRLGQPVDHAVPIRRIRGLRIGLPGIAGLSQASRSAEQHGLLNYFSAPEHILEVHFAAATEMVLDLRPALPLIFRGAS